MYPPTKKRKKEKKEKCMYAMSICNQKRTAYWNKDLKVKKQKLTD